jgi:hypothetical protein
VIREASDRIREKSHRERLARCSDGAKPTTLVPIRDLSRHPRSPKRLGHQIAATGHGSLSAGLSKRFIRSGWGDFGASFGRPRFRGIVEPHRQRDPTAYRVDFQNFDADDIARLRKPCADP